MPTSAQPSGCSPGRSTNTRQPSRASAGQSQSTADAHTEPLTRAARIDRSMAFDSPNSGQPAPPPLAYRPAPTPDYYPPTYAPEPTERRSLWKRLGSALAALGVLIAKVGVKLKALLLILPKLKILTTSGSMLGRISSSAFSFTPTRSEEHTSELQSR